jgi:hypothetical protein
MWADDPQILKGLRDSKYRGVEDARLFVLNNQLNFLAVTHHFYGPSEDW